MADGEQSGAEPVFPGAEHSGDPQRVGQRAEARVESVPASYGNRVSGPGRGDQPDPRERQRAERRINAICAQRRILLGGQAREIPGEGGPLLHEARAVCARVVAGQLSVPQPTQQVGGVRAIELRSARRFFEETLEFLIRTQQDGYEPGLRLGIG